MKSYWLYACAEKRFNSYKYFTLATQSLLVVKTGGKYLCLLQVSQDWFTRHILRQQWVRNWLLLKLEKVWLSNLFTSNMFYSIVLSSALFSTNDLEKMAKEISAMLLFKHPNVMSLIGVCLDGEMPLIIMPFMSNGSILEFVRNRKEELSFCSRANLELVWMCKYSL